MRGSDVTLEIIELNNGYSIGLNQLVVSVSTQGNDDTLDEVSDIRLSLSLVSKNRPSNCCYAFTRCDT